MSILDLYHFPLSGHSHRARLFLSLLGVPHRLVEVDLRGGEHKRLEFLRLNAFGQVPVLVHDGHAIADSNAILVYLAKTYGRTDWLPEDPVGAAAVQRWLSFAAGPLAHGPATARLICVFGARHDPAEVIPRAHAALARLEEHLQSCHFLVGDRPTIADLACYTYTAHAPEGRVLLAEYPNIRAWLGQIEALPGFVPMRATPLDGQGPGEEP